MEILWRQPPRAVALAVDKLDVWAARLDKRGAQLDELLAILSADERQRARQFRLDEPRRRFVVTRAVLRMLLGKYLALPVSQIVLENDPHGKPRLTNGPPAIDVRFNVAHSGELALIVATAGCEVGVDIERVRTVSHAEHIARRYFHPAETDAILAAAPPARDMAFLRCWTGKEAVLKAIGSGITGSMASFRVPTDEFNETLIELPAPNAGSLTRCWLCGLMPCEDCVGAVACLGEARMVRTFVFDL